MEDSVRSLSARILASNAVSARKLWIWYSPRNLINDYTQLYSAYSSVVNFCCQLLYYRDGTYISIGHNCSSSWRVLPRIEVRSHSTGAYIGSRASRSIIISHIYIVSTTLLYRQAPTTWIYKTADQVRYPAKIAVVHADHDKQPRS